MENNMQKTPTTKTTATKAQMVELTDAELDWVSGGDKPNASGWVGNHTKKNGELSKNPNDGPGASG
jgi:hypothetical protein